jgi:hypothetical protein
MLHHSVGRELRDERRQQLLMEKKLVWYLEKGRGGIFRDSAQAHGENPLRLVLAAAQEHPAYFKPTLSRVAALDPQVIRNIVSAIPASRASILAKSFAEAMMLSAQSSLTEILK